MYYHYTFFCTQILKDALDLYHLNDRIDSLNNDYDSSYASVYFLHEHHLIALIQYSFLSLPFGIWKQV